MTVLLLRHVHAGDRSAWRGDDRRRPASDRGRRQADALVDQLAPWRPTTVLTSPYLRCVESVAPLATAGGLPLAELDELAEGAPPDVVDRLLRRAAAVARAADGAAVCCSHGDVIGAVVTRLVHAGVVPASEARWPKAGTWVLTGLDGDGPPTATLLPPP